SRRRARSRDVRRNGSTPHGGGGRPRSGDAGHASMAWGRPGIGLGGRVAISAAVRNDPRGRVPGESGLAAEALAADGNRSEVGRVGLARFFAEKLLPVAPGIARAIASGAEPLQSYETVLAHSA